MWILTLGRKFKWEVDNGKTDIAPDEARPETNSKGNEHNEHEDGRKQLS